jgi:hypothetical protein
LFALKKYDLSTEKALAYYYYYLEIEVLKEKGETVHADRGNGRFNGVVRTFMNLSDAPDDERNCRVEVQW